MLRNQQQQRQLYSFPELKSGEILQCMEDLRIPLGEQELSKPGPAVVQRILEAFADIFMGIPREQFAAAQPSFGVMEMLEYPDLHMDSIGLISFYRTVLRLMLEVGVEDFSLRDLIRPEGPRLRLILSAVINFAKFREEQLAVFEDFSRKADQLVEERARLVQRRGELAKRVDGLRAQRRGQEDAAGRVREEIGGLIQELRDFKREQTGLSGDLDQLKTRRTELSEKLAHSQFLLGNIKQECHKLKSRIVHSPEKLLQIIAEMNGSIAAEKHNLTQLERKSRELQVKMDALLSIEQDVGRALAQLELNEAALRKKAEVASRTFHEQELIGAQTTTLNDLAIREQQLLRQLAGAQDKLGRLQTQQEARRQQVGERLRALQAEYGGVAEERARVTAKSEQAERVVKDFEARMGDLKRTHETEMVNLRADCLLLKSQVLAYSGEVKKAL